MAIKIVRYRFEQPLGDITEARFTLGTIDLAKLGQHAKLRRLYQEAWEQRADTVGRKLTEKEYEALDPELVSLQSLWSRWARVTTSLRSIECHMVNNGDAMDFVSGLDIFGWDQLEGIATVPVDLFEALDEAAVRCNPRVFGSFYPEEVDPKNDKAVGVISVS